MNSLKSKTVNFWYSVLHADLREAGAGPGDGQRLADEYPSYLNFHYYSKLSLIRLQLTRMSDNPDRNMENEKFCSQLSAYFKRTHDIYESR
jgi:hypothetical protein